MFRSSACQLTPSLGVIGVSETFVSIAAPRLRKTGPAPKLTLEYLLLEMRTPEIIDKLGVNLKSALTYPEISRSNVSDVENKTYLPWYNGTVKNCSTVRGLPTRNAISSSTNGR